MKRAVGIFLFCWIAFSALPAQAQSARALVDLGNRQFEAGEYDKALESYDKALAEQPESAEILFNKGAAFFKKGEYDKAREAYQASALKTRDLSLEASVHYNLGNTFFAEGQGQLDADPRKTLSLWEQSIHHFQEALRMDPQRKEAAQNLEVTRLRLKDLADRIKKAEEAAKEQQKRREEIKKALEEVTREQESEMAQNDALQEKTRQGSGRPTADAARQLAADQTETRDKTGNIADRMKDLASKEPARQPDNGQPPHSLDAVEHLEKAREAQNSAAQKLERSDLEDARKDQEAAIRDLKEALNSPENSGKGAEQDQASQREDGKKDDQTGDKDRQENASPNSADDEKENRSKSPENQQPGTPKSETAQKETGDKGNDPQKTGAFSQSPESIFREEKENRLLLHRDSMGGIKPVEKDW